ncbi:MAG: hypothetical protein K0R38_4964 [Polyangiaceae bacterium]|jgi:hypothetical protein|nr:hypothetical protein [Polyangiaceae bacterium]
MFARIPSALLPRRGHLLLVSALVGLAVVSSCTKSEDTEPFVPASEGAIQPEGGGTLLTEEEACGRLLDAYAAARKSLGCPGPKLSECPGFLRPGGGNACYQYSERSVEACEEAYDDAFSCQSLSPCIVTAERNDALPTCELPGSGAGGMGGVANEGGAPPVGGAPTLPEAGAPSEGGAAGAAAGLGGAPAGGASG